MMADSQAAATAGRAEPRHWLRIFLIWIVLSLAADLIIWFVWYPHLPPGRMSDAAERPAVRHRGARADRRPGHAARVHLLRLRARTWRDRPGDDGDGEPIHGHTGIQVGWILATSAIVLWAFAFGTYQLVQPGGAGGGEGPAPIWQLSGTRPRPGRRTRTTCSRSR